MSKVTTAKTEGSSDEQSSRAVDAVADRLGALVFRPSGSRTVAVDELELADDAQVIVF